jgi:hypothetical protein
MNCWQILGILPTEDQRAIKKAYISLVKRYPPEDHSAKFQEVRTAYEQALQWAADHAQREALGSESGPDPLPPLTGQERSSADIDPNGIWMESLGDLEDPSTDAPQRIHQQDEFTPPVEIGQSETASDDGEDMLALDTALEANREEPAAAAAISTLVAQIDAYLSADRQEEALTLFEQGFSTLGALSDRHAFESRLIQALAKHQTIPMRFTDHVFRAFGGDTRPNGRSTAGTPSLLDFHEKYATIHNLRRAFEQARHPELGTLRRKPNRLLLLYNAFYEHRRASIQGWIDALTPYANYYAYLGVSPEAIAAWHQELLRPQHPDDTKEIAFAILASIGYAYCAAAIIPWPFWAQLCVGVLLWLAFSAVSLGRPVLRWTLYKWREDWRPNASSVVVKCTLDLIPIGLLTLCCILSRHGPDGVNRAGAYAFYIFSLFIVGWRYFCFLSILSIFVLGFYPESGRTVIQYLVFCFWLKIGLTITDNWPVSQKASRAMALLIVTGCFLLFIHMRWPLPL